MQPEESIEISDSSKQIEGQSVIHDSEIKDEREPKLHFYDHFIILKSFGFVTWVLIFVGIIGSVGSGAIMLIFQFIFGDLVDIFQPVNGVMPTKEVQRNAISDVSLKFTYVAIGSLVSSFLHQYFAVWAHERIGIVLRKTYFNALTSQDIGFYDIKKTGALTLPLSDDITKVQDVWTHKLLLLMQHVATIIIGLILAFVSSWQMTLVSISTAPLMLVIGGVMGKFTEMLTIRSGEVLSKGAAKANEVVSSFKTVKSMGCEEREQLQYAQVLKKLHLYGIFNALTQGISMGSENLIMWGTSALAFWYAANLVVDGVISIGDLVKVFGLLIFAIFAMAQGFIILPDFSKAIAAQKTLLLVLNRKPSIPFKGGKIPSIGEDFGNVEFNNVKFSYPTRKSVNILNDFNLKIEKGQSVALVGPSGSGKSTIVGLLERFYDPENGNITIDGVDLKEIDPNWLHKYVGIVTQEPVLFATSIRENIAYAVGIENVKDSEIEQVAKAANCHNFIMDLPNGYNTLIGEKGVSLSGGQKQRIAIARALLQNPKILLLDEATSALDTESEALVQSALEILMKGRTSISIAHRLSTVRNCNVIYVLVKGEIKEFGTHSQLMNIENGIYRNLAEKQMIGNYDNGSSDQSDSEQNVP